MNEAQATEEIVGISVSICASLPRAKRPDRFGSDPSPISFFKKVYGVPSSPMTTSRLFFTPGLFDNLPLPFPLLFSLPSQFNHAWYPGCLTKPSKKQILLEYLILDAGSCLAKKRSV